MNVTFVDTARSDAEMKSPHVIRSLVQGDFLGAAALVRESFMHHIAPDWSEAARESFCAETTPELFVKLSGAGAFSIGLFEQGTLRGVLVMPKPSRLRMLFVDSRHLGRGIGRSLWQQARTHLATHHPDVQTVELNASPYAYGFYLHLGFAPLSREFVHSGARTTRMACWLPAERVGAALVDPIR
jgi:GNAT superfamily N-acetyltransferase